MRLRYSGLLFLLSVGCVPENSYEDDLAAARAEKAKHPERWHKVKKISKKEANAQQRRRLEVEDEFRKERIQILSRY